MNENLYVCFVPHNDSKNDNKFRKKSFFLSVLVDRLSPGDLHWDHRTQPYLSSSARSPEAPHYSPLQLGTQKWSLVRLISSGSGTRAPAASSLLSCGRLLCARRSRGQRAVPVLAARRHVPSCSRPNSAGAGDSRQSPDTTWTACVSARCGLRPNRSARGTRRRPTRTPTPSPSTLRARHSHHHCPRPIPCVSSLCHFHRMWPTLHSTAPADDSRSL